MTYISYSESYRGDLKSEEPLCIVDLVVDTTEFTPSDFLVELDEVKSGLEIELEEFSMSFQVNFYIQFMSSLYPIGHIFYSDEQLPPGLMNFFIQTRNRPAESISNLQQGYLQIAECIEKFLKLYPFE